MGKRHLIVWLTVWGIWGVCKAGVIRAEVLTFSVDPSQSILKLSGSAEGGELRSTIGFGTPPVNPSDSFTTSYTGIITANYDSLSNTLQILNGGVSAQINSLAVSDSTGNDAPGNYLGTAMTDPGDVIPNQLTTNILVRNFSFSITSPVITSPSSFKTSLLSEVISSGELDCALTNNGDTSNGSTQISGDLSVIEEDAVLAVQNGRETLTIPIEVTFSVSQVPSTNVNSIDSANILSEPVQLQMFGEIVAVANVPEPSSFFLVALPIFLLLAEKRVRRKSSF